jgi:hypothetical protein
LKEKDNPYEATAIVITDMTPIYISLPEISVIRYPVDVSQQYLICISMEGMGFEPMTTCV